MLELSITKEFALVVSRGYRYKEAAHALNWCVAEMERRYRLMAALGVRNLAGFNRQVKDSAEKGSPIKDPLSWVERIRRLKRQISRFACHRGGHRRIC